jgi:4-amino-4-deoxy-L-arabinose transferase-like glycosyltransferase
MSPIQLPRRLGIAVPDLLFCILVLFYLVNGNLYINSQSLTSDESSFYDYAKRLATGNPERVHPETDNSKMPVSVLNIAPRAVQQILNPELTKSDLGWSDMIMGRRVTLLFSLLTIMLVYRWGTALYGIEAGCFAAFLTAFCPNLLANAGLVTTDSYSVFMLLWTSYLLWQLANRGGWKYLILLSTAVAIAQLVKQSLFHLYILVPVCLLTWAIINKVHVRPGRLVGYVFLFAIINLIIINTGYYFSGTGMVLGDYHFMSRLFRSVQAGLPAWLPVPFPKPFMDGLDMAKYYDQVGGGIDGLSSFGKVTILGHSSTGGSFWYYYFVSLFFKVPVASMILIAWATIALVRQTTVREFSRRELFLLLPAVYYLLVFSFSYNTQCGLRHVIFILPLLYLFASSLISLVHRVYQKAFVGILAIFLVFSVLRYWRNYYPYTNEFIMKKELAYTYVGASNLEFQQGRFIADRYLARHPEVRMAGEGSLIGKVLINTADYLDIWNRHQFDRLRKYKPVAHVGYNWLLIDAPPEDQMENKTSDDRR